MTYYYMLDVDGEEYAIDYQYHGYDPDTGATELDWDFVGKKPERELTAKEIEDIEIALIKHAESDDGGA